MADVVFNKVTLCGFGLYKDPTTFILDPSLAVFAGPNESGKSTFVNGLLATLFGLLRREGDTEGFTTTRFKNWDSPPGFWGELEFTSSGKLYRLRREFESHETRLSIDGDGGPRILFDGEHNRFGRGTEVERYNGILKETLGVADQDLFESVFCVTQETDAGHGEERGGAVQQLVAASGERSFNDVVEKLVEAFRSVTRASGKYGIASPGKQPRDARNEQKLERVEADIRVLKQNIESSSDTLAGLAGLRNDLAEKEKGLERAREEQGRAKTTLEAWDKWEVLKRELHGQEKEQARLGNVISTCEGLVDNLGKAEEALLREYPEFEDAPPDFEDRADEMISLHSRRERIRREQETIESDVRGLFGESVFADRSMENVLEQLNRKADLERDLEEKGQDLQRIEAHYSNAREGRRRKAAAIGFVGFLGGLALGFGLRLETVELILTMVGAGILAGGIAFLVIRPRLEDPKDVQRFQRLTRDVIEIVRALAEVDSVLGELATAGAGELGELREKLRRHTVLAEEIKAADERTSELSSKLHSVLASTQGDPAGAKGRYAEFQKQVRSRDRIASELTVLLKAGQAESIGDLTGRKTHIDNTVQNLIT
ncbi:MAG: AAA family ATPase, partial [Candidatus Eisenbacteria sp.]|nr:AAA family ATPase [Candidatus Eisenbacteria bacterium]